MKPVKKATLPLNTYWVRHGESEGNVAIKRYKKGDLSVFEGEFGERHGSKWRLTDLGREQAAMAAKWIQEDPEIILGPNDGYFVSEYLRAKETAARLDLPYAAWKVDPYMRERDWGDLEFTKNRGKPGMMDWQKSHPFYANPPNGMSIAHTCLIADRVLNTFARDYPNSSVISVCHGEFMWAIRCRLEKLGENGFLALEQSEDPRDHIWNCQILHYSRVDESGAVHPHYVRMRSICPTDLSKSSNVWMPIVRKRMSNQELLEECEAHPRMIR